MKQVTYFGHLLGQPNCCFCMLCDWSGAYPRFTFSQRHVDYDLMKKVGMYQYQNFD